MVKGVRQSAHSSISHHSSGLVGTGSRTLNEWPMHMVMRHRVAYAYDNETHIADSSCPAMVHVHSTKTAYWVESCIMCPLFICKTSDCLTFALSLLEEIECRMSPSSHSLSSMMGLLIGKMLCTNLCEHRKCHHPYYASSCSTVTDIHRPCMKELYLKYLAIVPVAPAKQTKLVGQISFSLKMPHKNTKNTTWNGYKTYSLRLYIYLQLQISNQVSIWK